MLVISKLENNYLLPVRTESIHLVTFCLQIPSVPMPQSWPASALRWKPVAYIVFEITAVLEYVDTDHQFINAVSIRQETEPNEA